MSRKDLLRRAGGEERRRARMLLRAQRAQKHKLNVASLVQSALDSLPPEHATTREAGESILADPDQHGYAQLAAHWAAAIAKWTKAGCPTRTRAERAAIYAICRACPDDLFDADNQSCQVCGCAVKKSLLPISDKAAMATENCPNNHWS